MADPIIPGGYILLSRKIIESEIWDKPPLYLKVWVYLLSRAQHKEYKKLKRGQLRTSLPEIIEACSWKVGFRKEKPTKDQVYQVIDWLRKCSRNEDEAGYESNKNTSMITTMKATHGMLVTIENYDFYQTPSNYESNNGSEEAKEMNPIREQREPNNINKNVKNVKKKDIDQPSGKSSNSYTHDFEEFWTIYPKKVGKPKAFSCWKARTKTASKDDLIKAVQNYAKHCELQGTETRYTKHPSTFLGPNLDYEDWIEYQPEAPKSNVTPFPVKQKPEPARINMPSQADEERQRIKEEEMRKLKEEKMRKRKEAELSGRIRTSI